MSFFSELDPDLSQRSPEEMMAWFADPRQASLVPAADRELLLQEVAVHFAQTGAAGSDFLLAGIAGADEMHLRAILLGLSFADDKVSVTKRAEIQKAVQAFLDDARPLIVAQAIDALRHLGCKDAREAVLKCLHHESPYVVGSVLRFLAHHFPKDATPLLEQALESPEAIVRENAVDELDELGYAPALPKIKRLLKDKNNDVRQAAQTAVENLQDAE